MTVPEYVGNAGDSRFTHDVPLTPSTNPDELHDWSYP